MNEYAKSLLELPGTDEEKEFLEKRLEMQSVREGIVLAAAVERSPPRSMMDAVNCLLTLGKYGLCPAHNYEALGEFYLWESCVSQEQKPFFDKSALGQWYEDEHPGLFVGSCYVAYPDPKICGPYDRECSPSDDMFLDWSVRLKLASEQVPEGVWVKLPDYEGPDGKLEEVRLALEELKVSKIDECTLLEARCVLPCIRDLASQYEDLADLIYDSDSLGYFFDTNRDVAPGSLDKFLTVLECEGCLRLDDAVRIAEGLEEYEVISLDAFMDKVTQDLSKQSWAQAGDGVKGCFDYIAYAAALAEQQGYSVSDDGNFYIRRRDSPELAPQQTGMTM